MRALIAAAAAIALAGCTTPTWTHATKSKSDFERDGYECERDAAVIQDSWRAMQLYERCMRSKGWQPSS